MQALHTGPLTSNFMLQYATTSEEVRLQVCGMRPPSALHKVVETELVCVRVPFPSGV